MYNVDVGMNVRSWLILAAVWGTVLGCRTATDPVQNLGPVPDGSLMTDATGYVAKSLGGAGPFVQYEFAVETRFENRSTAPVFLARCFPDSPQPMYGIVAADSSGIQSAYAPFWGCVAHNDQFQILPGAVRVDTFLVRGPTASDAANPEGIGVTSGVFRLMLFVASAPGDGAPAAPGALGISNAFVVRTSK